MADLSAVIEEMKSILTRVIQAKHSPQEIERATAQGQKQLEQLERDQHNPTPTGATGPTGTTGGTGSTGATAQKTW